ncbi:MAG: RNA polymerase sigma factor [Gemmataceae bacterium]
MNPEELGQLMDRYLLALVLYARQWSPAPEDIVQEAFFKLVKQKPPPTHVVRWLYRTVRNAAIDSRRARQQRRRTETAAAEQKSKWFCVDIANQLDAQQASELLQSLPPENREVVIAHLWGNLTFEEIAEVVSCSPSTAHRRYVRSLEILRERLRIPCPNHDKNQN